MRRPFLTALLAGIVTCSLVGAAAPAAQANTFVVRCASSHLANDDPIVLPNRPGAAHRHEFFGARGVHASSTAAELRAAPTTCAHAGDTASYWAPSLEVDGRLVRGELRAYYARNGKARAAAPPQGLRVVVGDMHATEPQSMLLTHWQCVGGGDTKRHRTVPKCRAGQQLGARILFPDCWNGRQLDSADHRSHLAPSARGACPPTHPVALMQLTMLVTWDVRPASAEHVSLGGGRLAAAGMHADFWNTWKPGALQALRWECIEVARPCGEVRTPKPVRASAIHGRFVAVGTARRVVLAARQLGLGREGQHQGDGHALHHGVGQ